MLNAYIDESGIMTNSYKENHRYFIIAIIMTKDKKKVRKRFKDSRLRSIKGKPNLIKKLKKTREIKGINISEVRKAKIYANLLSFQKQNNDALEIGVIIVDNKNIKPIFRENKARSFNYLLGRFLKWRQGGISPEVTRNELSLMIDERNVATGSRFTLQDYLNTELRLKNGDELFKNEIKVRYCDSKNENLVQLADFVANTIFRSLNKNSNEVSKAQENIVTLEPLLTNGKIFRFPL